MDEIKRYLTEWTDENGNVYLVRDKNAYSKEELTEKIQGLVDGSLEPIIDKLASKDYVSEQLSSITSDVSSSIETINKLSKDIESFATKEYVESNIEGLASKDYVSNAIKDFSTNETIESILARLSNIELKLSNIENRVTILEGKHIESPVTFVNDTGEELSVIYVDENSNEYSIEYEFI